MKDHLKEPKTTCRSQKTPVGAKDHLQEPKIICKSKTSCSNQRLPAGTKHMLTPLRGTSDLFCALSPWRMVPDWGDMGLPLVAEAHINSSALRLSPTMTSLVGFPTLTLPPPKYGVLLLQWSAPYCLHLCHHDAAAGSRWGDWQHLRHHWLRARVNSISRISCLAVADARFLMGATHILSSAAHPTTFSATVKTGSDTASPKPRCWRMKSGGPTGANARQSSSKRQNAAKAGRMQKEKHTTARERDGLQGRCAPGHCKVD